LSSTAGEGAAHAEVVRALAKPAFYPHHPTRVQHVQTHISHVFLAGPYVYKKAVTFPFLDFATRATRRRFCDEELRLNRRLAPAIYLDVTAVVRTPDGELTLGRPGVGEHLVRLGRDHAAEFSVAFRCNDVASEVAFLTMDLERRGRRDLAEAPTCCGSASPPRPPTATRSRHGARSTRRSQPRWIPHWRPVGA
jgi:aminoglycoside phosphotransferase family enzyme